MDQRRRGDPRIYIVTLLFLSCILSGGILLGLYLHLPDPNPLFLPAGMFFVCVPWLFWFLAYLYSCVLKPCTVSVSKKSVTSFDPEKGEEKNNKNVLENEMSASDNVAEVEPSEKANSH
ncbi:putative membrane lipoprotein [Hirschfeldia incana]|nr:putative membrane lipoprotein [Hirschfeldia incana]